MQSYIVETYLPKLEERGCREAAARARRVSAELSLAGFGVRYLRSLFVADDETCFYIFDAESMETVEAASRLAGLGYVRIVPVTLEVGAPS
jgi:Protein of unknown function (DUF4242)